MQVSVMRIVVLLRIALGAAALGGCASETPSAESDADAGAGGSRAVDCVPYEDDCEAGTYCQYVDGRTQCVAEGTIARDEPCGSGRCMRGSICMPATYQGTLCQQPCPLGNTEWCDITRHTCFTATADAGAELSFGVCRY